MRIDRPGEEATLRGMPLTSLAAEFDKPLLVIDEDQVRDRARTTRQTFESAFGDVAVYYAGKALLTTDVAGSMTSRGPSRRCLLTRKVHRRAGCGGARRTHGVPRQQQAQTLSLRRPLALVSARSSATRQRRSSESQSSPQPAGAVQAVQLRVSIGVHASTHEYLATSHEDQKFGVAAADAPALVARSERLRA